MCPNACFGCMYKFSAWNSYKNVISGMYIFSRDYFGELAKRWWNSRLIHEWQAMVFVSLSSSLDAFKKLNTITYSYFWTTTQHFKKDWFAARWFGCAEYLSEYLSRNRWIICSGADYNKQITTCSSTYAKLRLDWIWQNRCNHPFHRYY